MKLSPIILCGVLLAEFFCGPARAHVDSKTVILHPAADTAIFEAFPDNNMGASSTLPVGANQQGKRGRPLVRFDLSAAMPTNAIILTVYLNVTAGKMAANSVNTAIEVHRVLQAWTEGIQSGNNGGLATPGDPTWNSRSSPDIGWAQLGGKAGVDYAARPSASQTLVAAGPLAFDTGTNMVFDVQNWVTDPASNHGWILISAAENTVQSAVRINSKEASDSLPELTVEYFIPDPVFQIEEAEKSGIYFLIHLNLEASNAYTLQFRDDLDASPWQIATNFPPDASFRHYIWVEPCTNVLRRFFRFGVTKPAP